MNKRKNGRIFSLFIPLLLGFSAYGQCISLTSDDILTLRNDIALGSDGESVSKLSLHLADDFNGKLWLNETNGFNAYGRFKAILPDTVICLTPILAKDHRSCLLDSESPIPYDTAIRIDIEDGAFEISPEYIEVEDIDLDENLLSSFSIAGAWHKKGSAWTHPGMFSIIDDDGLDGQIKSSTDAGTFGYFSLMYPLLENLGLRGVVAGEGRRMGLSGATPEPNDNFRTLVRLQNEKGWEIMSHSMICIGEILNNWKVDSLTAPLAKELLTAGPNNGEDASTISIYDLQTKKQYWPNADNTSWVETSSRFIKPYIGDYATKQAILFNPDYDFAWHWGEWKRAAIEFGLDVKGFVTHNTTSSHYLVPGIMEYFPQGFSDLSTININTPPLLSSAVRAGLEGQSLKGYAGESKDNTFNEEHFKAFCSQIDEAAESGGWIVFNLHAYRACWRNYFPEALVSAGGTYPDSWVVPMRGIDSANDPYTPPAKLGIKDWSEWYPCPGTRLDMLWRLLKYAKEKGLINVTSSEGFAIMGNKKAYGYFSKGQKIGQDGKPTIGIRDKYPHYIVGANDETYYFNPIITPTMTFETDSNHVETLTEGKLIKSGHYLRWISSCDRNTELRIMDMTGATVIASHSNSICLEGMQKGIYIVGVYSDRGLIKSMKVAV